MLCQTRCRCLENLETLDLSVPNPAVVRADQNPFGNLDLNPVRILQNEFEIRMSLLQYHGPHVPISVVNRFEFLAQSDDMAIDVFALLPQEGTYQPICTGNLPPTTLPPPFTRNLFNNLRTLCSAEAFGGSPRGNAGAICSINSPTRHLLEFDEFLLQYLF
jgi:hypothetical protein